MPGRTPEQCLARLRVLYRDAHKCEPASNALVISWALHPEAWAEQQIRHRNWSYFAAEAVVRSCRAMSKRAALAVPAQPDPSADPFDSLMPTAAAVDPDCGCLPVQQGGGCVIQLHPTSGEPA